MAFFKKRPKTAQQKAQGAQMRILIRFLCCAYIIFYVIIPLMRDVPDGDSSMSPTFRLTVVAVFIAVTAAIIVFTIVEVIRNWKAGLYKATAYTDDESENLKFGIRNSESEDEENSEFGIRNSESEDEDENDESLDEYEDEEYDDDDDDDES